MLCTQSTLDGHTKARKLFHDMTSAEYVLPLVSYIHHFMVLMTEAAARRKLPFAWGFHLFCLHPNFAAPKHTHHAH